MSHPNDLTKLTRSEGEELPHGEAPGSLAYHVYVLENAQGRFYVGQTKDPPRRRMMLRWRSASLAMGLRVVFSVALNQKGTFSGVAGFACHGRDAIHQGRENR
jgi:hypothetical protein